MSFNTSHVWFIVQTFAESKQMMESDKELNKVVIIKYTVEITGHR